MRPWFNPVQLLWLTLLISNEGILALTSSKQHNNLSADKTENSSEVIESIIGDDNQCELQSLEISFHRDCLKLGRFETIGSNRYPIMLFYNKL